MDPITSGLLSGLAVNALTHMAGPVARLVTNKREELRHYVAKHLKINERELVRTLLARLQELGCPEADKTRLARFLRTQDAEVYMRALVVARLTNELKAHRQELRAQLTALLAFTAELNHPAPEQYTETLFDILWHAADRAINAIGQRSPELVVRMERIASDELNAGYLRAAANITSFLSDFSAAELASIYRFVGVYRKQVRVRHQYITPPHLDERRRVAIDDLYVTPRFETRDFSRYVLVSPDRAESRGIHTTENL